MKNNFCHNSKVQFLLIGLFCFYILTLPAQQNQAVADSLEYTYRENKLKGVDKLELLKNLAYNEINDLEKAIRYAEELIELSDSLHNNVYLYSGHLQKGYKLKNLGKYKLALDEFIECNEIAKTLNDLIKQGTAYSTMAEIAGKLDNISTAVEYYEKAINILSQTDNTVRLAITQFNLGEVYLNNKEYDKAEQMFEKSWPIFMRTNNQTNIAYYYGNMGMVYSGQKKDSLGELNLNRSITMLDSMENYPPVCTYLLSLAEIYQRKGNMPKAFDYVNKSLELANKINLKEKLSDAYLRLSELYDATGNIEAASEYRKKYIDYIKSSFNPEANNTADLLRYHEVSQEQAETDLANQKVKTQRIIVYATASTLLFIVWITIVLYRKNKFVRATNKIISTEKQRSDNLLLNILPEDTAQELKDRGKVQAKRFELVTIMFTDFEGFTKYAEQLPPEKVVTAVDFYFSKFDEIIGKFGLEKIKTVGDAYMCAGGLPLPTEDHAHKTVLAAFEIIKFVNEVKTAANQPLLLFDIRIGINTGPVVAGVVGNKKFAYDIWGDSVNIASRMESASTSGRINISENTYELVKDKFNCKFRGKIEVKNRGILKMYYVDSVKSFES